MLLLVILVLVAKRACDRSPGQWFRRGREYGGGGGGDKPIKANFQPSHGAKGCLSGKTPATPKDPLEVLSFHKRTQEPL